jgi:hypothetical protein
MRVSRLLGCVAATALLGCVPGMAYRDGFWAGFRQNIGKAFSGAEEDGHNMRFQTIEPREEKTDPPYGYQPPPLTEETSSSSSSSSSSESSTSTWGGETTYACCPLSESKEEADQLG